MLSIAVLDSERVVARVRVQTRISERVQDSESYASSCFGQGSVFSNLDTDIVDAALLSLV